MIEFGPGLLAALRDLGRAFSSGYGQGRSGAAYLPFKPAQELAEPAQEPEDDEPAPKAAPKPKKAKKAKPAADKPKKKKKAKPKPAPEPEAEPAQAPEPEPAPKKPVPDSVKPPTADPKAKKAVTRYNKRKTARQTVDMATCKPLEDNPDRLKCKSAAGTVVYKDRPERIAQTIDVKAGPT